MVAVGAADGVCDACFGGCNERSSESCSERELGFRLLGISATESRGQRKFPNSKGG